MSGTPAARADKIFKVGLFIEMPFDALVSRFGKRRSASTIEAVK
ncbi:hypothetical protein [Promicromonospora soli]